MFTGILHMHKLAVILFLLLYLVKATLLVLNKKDTLKKFTRAMKVPEILISTLFLATGIYLSFDSGSMGAWFWVKMAAVLTSVPLAIIAFKRMNKPMALLAVMFIVYAYGLSETKSLSFKPDDLGESFEGVEPEALGLAIYEQECINCHGADGQGGVSGAKDLSASTLNRDERLAIIRSGKNAMMPYKDRLTGGQVEAVATYVESLAAN